MSPTPTLEVIAPLLIAVGLLWGAIIRILAGIRPRPVRLIIERR